MEIIYIGHSCFLIKGKKVSIVIDPYDPEMTGFKMPKQNCQILINTHQHGDHNFNKQVNHEKLIDSAGEYEINDVYLTGIQTFHDSEEGKDRGKNLIFQIEVDGFSILHLGDLGHELNEKIISKIGNIDVLMIPVGGKYTLDVSDASKVISSLEPHIVIPMHYQEEESKMKDLNKIDKFLHEMGEGNPEKLDSLKLTSSLSSDDKETKIVLLNPIH